jgi:hypothetical protein
MIAASIDSSSIQFDRAQSSLESKLADRTTPETYNNLARFTGYVTDTFRAVAPDASILHLIQENVNGEEIQPRVVSAASIGDLGAGQHQNTELRAHEIFDIRVGSHPTYPTLSPQEQAAVKEIALPEFRAMAEAEARVETLCNGSEVLTPRQMIELQRDVSVMNGFEALQSRLITEVWDMQNSAVQRMIQRI